MQTLSKRDKIILILAFSFAILYIYYAFLLKPVVTNINITRTKIIQDKAKMKDAEGVETLKSKYEKQFNELQPKYADALRTLPVSERDPEISIQIKSFSDKEGLKLTSLNFGKPTDVKSTVPNSSVGKNSGKAQQLPKLISVPVTINLNGEYLSIVNFINDIEKNKRIASVNSVTIESGKEDYGNIIKTTINATFLFTQDNTQNSKLEYDFNKGNYGKSDLFK